jgi:5-methylcytosine-specific restriction endonuclease McrA
MSESLVIVKHMSEKSTLSHTNNLPANRQRDLGLPDPDAQLVRLEPSDPVAQLVPLERLEERICELAAHLAAGTCRFLELVGEFDARRGWECWDLPSCAAWLAWKCQVAPGTAREQVRVARALPDLPVIHAEFAAGRMSYAKVRALTRIATALTESDLAEITGPMTAAQCERFVAAHRTASDAGDLTNRATRRVSVHVREDGWVAINARLPAADAAVVLQALRAAAGDCEHPHRAHSDPAEDGGLTPHTSPSADGVSAETRANDAASEDSGGAQAGRGTATCRASLADALVEVAGAYLSGKVARASNPDIYQVIVHVGPEALSAQPGAGDPSTTPSAVRSTTAGTHPNERQATPRGVSAETAGVGGGGTMASPGQRPAGHPAHLRRCHLDDGPALSPAAAQAIACHATLSWMMHDHDGNLLDVGRRHRRATPALRRAVRERDRGRCQFPGCRSRRTDIHHVIPWAKGGKTRLRDLVLLCEAHHVIVHALGWVIAPAPGGGFAFTRPDGRFMPNGPTLPGSDGNLAACHDAEITTETIVPTGLADKLDLDLAIWACFANARITAQRANEDQHDHDLAA